MKIEHIAFNVSDPLAMGRWYVEHLGFTVKRRTVEPPYAHFLADDNDAVMIEIYHNPQAPVIDFAKTATATLHLAIVSQDIDADIQRLTKAGATVDTQRQPLSHGDEMAFLRDPWGVTLQLIRRSNRMI